MRDVLVARDSSIFRLLEYFAGLVTLFERSVVAIMRPPVKWRLDFLEQCWLILKRCTIPLAITTFAAGVGTEGFDPIEQRDWNYASTLLTLRTSCKSIGGAPPPARRRCRSPPM